MSNEYKDWAADKIEEEKQILEKYPFLKARTVKGDIDTKAEFPMMELEIPNGWEKLFYQMCDDIKPILEQNNLMDKFYFIQVKEKYDELRCYTNDIEPSSIRVILQKYEYLSKFVCVNCGKPAEFVTFGYIISLCKDCLNKHMPANNYTNLQFIDTYEVVGFDIETKEQHTETISVKEEWERYLKNV
jgi:hypothetical protein